MTNFLQRMIAAKIHSAGVIQPRPRPIFETRIPHPGSGLPADADLGPAVHDTLEVPEEGAGSPGIPGPRTRPAGPLSADRDRHHTPDERAAAGNPDTGRGTGNGQVPSRQETRRGFSLAVPSPKREGERPDTGTGIPRSGHIPVPGKTSAPMAGQVRHDRKQQDIVSEGKNPEPARSPDGSPRSRSPPAVQDTPPVPPSQSPYPAGSRSRHAGGPGPSRTPAENPESIVAATLRKNAGDEPAGMGEKTRSGRAVSEPDRENGSRPAPLFRAPEIHDRNAAKPGILPALPIPSRTPPANPPTIRVSIGRIEVRAETEAPVSQPVLPKQPVPLLSLDDYLRSRRGDAS